MSNVKHLVLLALAIGSGLFLAGCEPKIVHAPAQPTLSSIAVAPASATMQIGATQALTVTGTFSDASTQNLTSGSMFLSSNSLVALVNGTGVVTAQAAGTATITATHNSSGKTATATITVAQPSLVALAITPKPVNLVAGTTQQLTVTGTFSNAATADKTTGSTFSSDTTSTATVSSSGLVMAIAAGTATITATETASGKTDTVLVTVTAAGGGGGGWPTITFDDVAITYGRTDFGGVVSAQVADPTNASNQVGRVVKPTTAQVWGGTTVSTVLGDMVPTIPFSATATTMTVRVYSPAAGLHVRLKVEDAADGTHSVETEALTTMSNAWETLTFDFATQATGTAALNLAYTYNRASLFFDFGAVPGADETFYFDDIAFVSAGGGGGGGWPTITFDDVAITYGRTDFGGVVSAQVADPTNASNQVGRVVKPTTAQVWGGTTVSTVAGDKVPTIPFSATATTMTVRVYSPAAGLHVRLKVEDAADGTHSVETEALTTMSNAWETLTFDFATQATGTAALNLAYTYNRASLFFDFGTVPGADETFYFDDIAFVSAGGGGGGGWPTITFDDVAITYGRTDFGGVVSAQVIDPTNASNQVSQVVKPTTAQVWGGTTVSTVAGDKVTTMPFSATATTMTVRVYSPAAGLHIRLKVEDAADGTHSVETEALTTMGNAWETLTFDFATQATGTAALNLAYTYNRASLFFDFGTVPVADETFYFDDIAFAAGGGGGGGGGVVVSRVFTGGALDTGVIFAPFGGADNTPLPAPDAGTLFTDGTAALKVVVTGTPGNYSGGAWVASAPRDLRTANAVVFWAKASQTQGTLKVQFGNDAGAGANVNFQVENIGLQLTTNWQQFAIPLPDPAKANGIDGLFSFADSNNNYTFWLANVQFVNLPSNVLGTGFVAGDGFNSVPLAGSPPSLSIASGSTYAIGVGPNSIVWTLGSAALNGSPLVPLANGGNLNNDAWRWFTLTSSDTAVATVDADGLITGVAAGTATITGTLAGTAIPGNVPVTVTAPLGQPMTNAPTPALAQGNVIAMFDSHGIYTQSLIDNLNENWCGAGASEAPYAIPGGTTVLNYVLPNCTGIGFESNPINVTAAGMSSFHMDIWTPNPVALTLQLVDAAGGGVGSYTPTLVANSWNSIDVPISSFAGLSATTALQQIGLINGGNYTVLYIDNIYFHN